MPKPEPLTGGQLGHTLVNQLAPVVAQVRQLGTILGIRPYRVFVVRGAWSGASRGEGDFAISQSVEILPTPKVDGLNDVRRSADSGGLHEKGGVKVSEIVPKGGGYGLSEDDLMGNANSRPLSQVEEVYVNIQEDGGVTRQPTIRRYRIRGVPELHQGNVEWLLRLDRVESDSF